MMTPASEVSRFLRRSVLSCTVLVLLAAPGFVARADEGMWTFDNVPSAVIGQRYGFTPTPEWLEKVRLSSARIAGGCSASFVSPDGLVMTNHHCVEGCVQDLSTRERDLNESGFLAAAATDEQKCPGYEINQLQEIRDVTKEVQDATAGLEGEAYVMAQRGVKARLEKTCAEGDEIRCDLVTLYGGGQYHLYRYRRWQDVRLVFAPEMNAAFFGGDPDNFNFPRYCLDSAFLRVYDGQRPARTSNYFPWSPDGAKAGDLTFVSGNPGSTHRLSTVAELEFERDRTTPERLVYLSEQRGMLTEFGNRGPAQKAMARDKLFGVENSLKGLRGRQKALNVDFFERARKVESQLRQRVESDPALKEKYAGAWDAIARAKQRYGELRPAHRMLEEGQGFASKLFDYGRKLVRAGEELPKPSEMRLPEFADAQLPRLRQSLFDAARVEKELEVAQLTFSLTKLREEMGADDPFVRRLFGLRSPQEIAEVAVLKSRLDDPAVRRALFEGGASAVNASDDPMIVFVRSVDPDARAVRKVVEDEVDSVLKRNGERIANARFAIYGTSVYPDATFSARLSFGRIEGWKERGGAVNPFTNFRGMYDRQTGREPFNMPKRWLDARSRVDLDTPLDFVTTNDIIGGNSGSPVIDRDGRIVGLVFDGNIHSLGGDYGFDPVLNRTVAVHSRAILEALEDVYGFRRLVDEIKSAETVPPAGRAGNKAAAPAAKTGAR